MGETMDISAAMDGTTCSVCGCAKAASQPFCATDMAALPLPLRLALGDPARRAEAFPAARRHLELNRERKHELNDWPYATDDDLEAAGFQWSQHKRCEVPGCGQRISIWITPKTRRRVALDRFTRQPHRVTCADPTYFQRQRDVREQQKRQAKEARRAARLQTSAKRRTA